MKQLDWKSFAIGVLLTTTVMFGTGAETSTTEKWDADQKWDIKSQRVNTKSTPDGYEPFLVNNNGTSNPWIIWRKRIQ